MKVLSGIKCIVIAGALVLTGCASRADLDAVRVDVDRLKRGHAEHARELTRQRAELARQEREIARVAALYDRQDELVGQLGRAIEAMNTGVRRADDRANSFWRNLQTVQQELERLGMLQCRYRPVQHGDLWVVVYQPLVTGANCDQT